MGPDTAYVAVDQQVLKHMGPDTTGGLDMGPDRTQQHRTAQSSTGQHSTARPQNCNIWGRVIHLCGRLPTTLVIPTPRCAPLLDDITAVRTLSGLADSKTATLQNSTAQSG